MKQGRETTLEERIQIVRECIACGNELRRDGIEIPSKLSTGA